MLWETRPTLRVRCADSGEGSVKVKGKDYVVLLLRKGFAVLFAQASLKKTLAVIAGTTRKQTEHNKDYI